MKLIENLNYFVKVVGGGKEFYVHSTVKSVIKEKRHGNYFNNMLVKNEERKKKP